MSRPSLRSNCSVIAEAPAELVEVIWFSPGIWPAGIAGRAARAADLGAVAQPVGAVDHHLVADRQPLDHGDLLAVGGAGLDDADLDRIVGLHAIDEGAGLAALNGGDRHHD